ncbi:MAG: hypothetical protein F6J92_13755 [Symploca sp. SIO1A3]|nr:hypothetical protein [Symploca sp. SIO1A3]
MTETTAKKIIRRGRLFPEIQWSSEEKASRKAESEAFEQRCRAIFERVLPQLIEQHYGWYISVEPDSGDYVIDPDKETARNKAHQKHPNKIHCMFCLNDTGATGRI